MSSENSAKLSLSLFCFDLYHELIFPLSCSEFMAETVPSSCITHTHRPLHHPCLHPLLPCIPSPLERKPQKPKSAFHASSVPPGPLPHFSNNTDFSSSSSFVCLSSFPLLDYCFSSTVIIDFCGLQQNLRCVLPVPLPSLEL